MKVPLDLLLFCGTICGFCLTAQAAPATRPAVHEIARLDECGGGKVLWSRDGSKLITLNGSNLTSGTQLQAQVWDARTHKPIGARLDHGLPISRVEFEANATKVLTVGYDDDGKLQNEHIKAGQARLWDANTGRLLRTVTHGNLPLTDAALTPDGKVIATCARNDATVRLIDAETGNLKATLVQPGNVRCVRFDPTGNTLLTFAGGKVRLWDVPSRKIRAEVESTDEPLDARDPLITPDGKRLVLPGFYHVGIFHMATGRTQAMVDLQTGLDESSIGFSASADGSRIATTTFGTPTGGVWDVSTGRRLFSFDHCFDRPVLSPDGRLVLIEYLKKRGLCDVTSNAFIKLDDKLELSNAEFSPDNQRIAIPRFDGTTSIYAVAEQRE